MRLPVRPRSTLASLAVLAHGALALPATADEAPTSVYYTEMRVGANRLDAANTRANGLRLFQPGTEFDTGTTVGIAFGRTAPVDWMPAALRNLRFEVEFGFDQNDFDVGGAGNAELTATRLMANTFYQLPLSGRFAAVSPYLGVGVGAAIVEADGIGLTDNDDTVFAWQVRAGFSYRLREDMDVSVGYRFLDTEDPAFRYAPGRIEAKYRSHAAEVGFRYRF